MMPIFIIIALICASILVSIILQILTQVIIEDMPFDFKNYTWKSWFVQITWWILQASLLAWGLLKLYPYLPTN